MRLTSVQRLQHHYSTRLGQRWILHAAGGAQTPPTAVFHWRTDHDQTYS
jgi:hypothetical protein